MSNINSSLVSIVKLKKKKKKKSLKKKCIIIIITSHIGAGHVQPNMSSHLMALTKKVQATCKEKKLYFKN